MTVLYFIFILSWFHDGAFGLCNRGWHQYRDKCYHVNQESASWIGGMKMCEYHGGKLVQITSVTEDLYIKSLLRHRYKDADFWIGGSDWTVEGEWLWEPDGISMTYTDWYPGQPNNGFAAIAYPFASQQEHQNCIAMAYQHNYQWIDSNCDDNKHTICEKHAVEPVTTPVYTDTTVKTTPSPTTPTTRETTETPTTKITTETPTAYTTETPTTTAPTPGPTKPTEVLETQTSTPLPTTVRETTPVTTTTTTKQTTPEPEETTPLETSTTTMTTTTTEPEFVLIGRDT